MRKLEGIVKEVSDELGYLKAREERFSQTNGQLRSILILSPETERHVCRVYAGSCSKFLLVHHHLVRGSGCVADPPLALVLQAKIPY
jgi:hypothetical protein